MALRLRVVLVVGVMISSLGCDASPRADEDGGALRADATAHCVSDSECDDELFCNGSERCRPDAPGASSRGCLGGSAPCAAGTACDEVGDQCTGVCADGDGDGFASALCGGDDCDDADPDRYPGNVEVCDADDVDEDCDLDTFGDLDADDDGSVSDACCNGSTCGDDCADDDGGRHPGEAETCNLVDEDCDGRIDEGLPPVTLYRDLDGDDYGDEAVVTCGLLPGLVPAAGDCDESDATIHPTADEICDGRDQDCDAAPDDGCPASVAAGGASAPGVWNGPGILSAFASGGNLECPAGMIIGNVIADMSDDQGIWRFWLVCRDVYLEREGAGPYTYRVRTMGSELVGPFGTAPGVPPSCLGGGPGSFISHTGYCPDDTIATGFIAPNSNTRRFALRCRGASVVEGVTGWMIEWSDPMDSPLNASCRFDGGASWEEPRPRALVGFDVMGAAPIQALRVRFRDFLLATL